MSTQYEVNIIKARQMVETIFAMGRVPYLHSSPGMGKSSMAHSIAKDNSLVLIDIRLSQCDPTDLNGFPAIVDGVAQYLPFNIFPTMLTEKPKGMNGWLVLLDEFPSAPKAVQAASYKLVLDKMVGMVPLHPDVFMMAAGNKATDRAIVNAMSTASQTRFIHISLKAEYEAWLKVVGIPHNYTPEVMGFLAAYPHKLMDFDPAHKKLTFPCPRTWEFVNDFVKLKEGEAITADDAYLIAGCIADESATEFVNFCDVFNKLVTTADIIADPQNSPIPSDIASRWAMASKLSGSMTKQTVVPFTIYLGRFSSSFRIMTINMIIGRDRTWLDNPEVQQLAADVAEYIYS